MENVIIEAGHYYSVKGPTIWAKQGVEIMQKLRKQGDKTMLFIDDVHSVDDVHSMEKFEEIISLDFKPDFVVMESEMIKPAKEILYRLKNLDSKKKRAIRNPKDGKYYISGFPITKPDGMPLCILLDVALTVHKANLGFQKALNILPYFYDDQQMRVQKIISKIIPEFELKTMFFGQR